MQPSELLESTCGPRVDSTRRLEEDETLNQTARFLPEDSATLRLTLVKGRFPNPDAAEAVVTEKALKHV